MHAISQCASRFLRLISNRRFWAICLALTILITSQAQLAAQSTSPMATPTAALAPSPTDCTVEPIDRGRYIEVVDEVYAEPDRPVSLHPAITFETTLLNPMVGLRGEFHSVWVNGELWVDKGILMQPDQPASPSAEVFEEISKTLYLEAACWNAAKPLTNEALRTEKGCRELARFWKNLPMDKDLFLSTIFSTFAPPDYDFLHFMPQVPSARVLDENHVAVIMWAVPSTNWNPSGLRGALIVFKKVGEAWLIDGELPQGIFNPLRWKG